MDQISIVFVPEENITQDQKKALQDLRNECFSNVSQKYIEENFFAKGFARLFARKGSNIVATLELFKRKIQFDGENILLGGMGGVCVTGRDRKQGIAAKMIREGMRILKENKCDIACLNVDLKKNTRSLYEKIGFALMTRKISYENSKGEVKYDDGTMFISICSEEIYLHIMNSNKIFHYGKGYW